MFSIAKSRPPRDVKEFGSLDTIGGNGLAAVRNGDILVNWGAKLPDTNEEPGGANSPEVLAYPKQVPQEGGFVLMLDRTVKKMTAEEFAAAPKPQVEAGSEAPEGAASKK